MQHSTMLVFILCSLPAVYLCITKICTSLTTLSKLKSIPTVGPSGVLSSYYGAFLFLTKGNEVVQKGYDQYKGTIFKVPTFSEWLVIVADPSLVDDIGKASDAELSSHQAMIQVDGLDFVIGPEILDCFKIAPTVLSLLTRNFGVRIPDLYDEIVYSFQELIPTTENGGWVEARVSEFVEKLLSRVLSRLFVGLPLCRDPGYVTHVREFGTAIRNVLPVVRTSPGIVKPIFARLLTKVPAHIEYGTKYLEPIIQERLGEENQYGPDRHEKPNDFISWYLQAATEEQKMHPDFTRHVTLGVLLTALSGTLSSATTLSQLIFDLARFPQYVPELREEIESVMQGNERWDKASIEKLHKLESFIMESQRLSGIAGVSVNRKVLKDFRFSNGVVVPAGSIVGVPIFAIHHDSEYFSAPDQFDAFRFAGMRAKEQEGSVKHRFSTLGTTYLPFGIGRGACPGRFFAAVEMKMILAYILLTYDVKLDNPRGRPLNYWLGVHVFPNPFISVSFRKRAS